MTLNYEEIGKTLLSEVREESFLEILYSLRELHGIHDENYLNVPSIDRIVQIFEQNVTLSRPPVVEFVSSGLGSGTTHLLYYLIAVSVLSRTSYNVGKGGIAVIYDIDGNFDVDRLSQVMLNTIETSETGPNRPDDSYQFDNVSAVEQALQHIYIVRPKSFASLVSSIRDLPSAMLDLRNSSFQHSAVDLIALDSVSAFYWQQLNNETHEEQHEEDVIHQVQESNIIAAPYEDLVAQLQHAQNKFKCPVVATSLGLTPISHQGPMEHPSFRPLLPSIWRSFCNITFVVGREPVKKFHAGITFQRADQDARARRDVVDQGKFCAWLNQWGSSNWGDQIRKALREDDRNHRFFFHIRDAGVEMLDE